MFDDQTEPQLVTKFLLQVSVRELHTSLVSDTNDGGLKDARYEDDNIIINNSTLRSLLLPQLKQIPARYKVVCSFECCISAKSIHSSLLSWCDRYLKKRKDKIQNAKSRRSGDKAHHIYETYKNTLMPHWLHIYPKSSDIPNATMCTYPQSDHALPQWKCVLRWFAYFPYINLPDQETNKKT